MRPRRDLATALLILAIVPCAGGQDASRQEAQSLETILHSIEALERRSDPKCHASATRLENFMYGTPLSAEARHERIASQKTLVLSAWSAASSAARAAGDNEIGRQQMSDVLTLALRYEGDAAGGTEVALGLGTLTLDADDLRQYRSVAYSLRAILAVQQELLFDPARDLLPLSTDAIAVLREVIDVRTLAALQLADTAARLAARAEVSAEDFAASWKRLAREDVPPVVVAAHQAPISVTRADRFVVLRGLVAQKVAAYAAYNDVSMPLFWQNIRSYFARHPWPDAEREQLLLQRNFATSLVRYIADLLLRAEAEARRRGQRLIDSPTVEAIVQGPTPFELNEHEDVVFFPALPITERVVVESYDADAFRDSGLHWKLLGEALDHPSLPLLLELDPFAAEVVTEAASQFGVLLFRVAGRLARETASADVRGDHILAAVDRIEELAARHRNRARERRAAPAIASAAAPTPASGALFTDVTESLGVAYQHRSSDWLSRFQRSYLYSLEPAGAEAAPSAVDTPPSFSGGGIAAEDVDADGWPDLLLVGGAGNRLFLNKAGRRFVDATSDSGIDHRRSDGHSGEARQPLIADFDNDGRPDILITYVDEAHRLYRNEGDGRFLDVTKTASLGGEGLVGGPAAALDFDRDGLLDIYIGYFGNYLDGTRPLLRRHNDNATRNRLFRNVGDLTFEDVTETAGVGDTGWAQAVVSVDLDADGWQDIVVANDFGRNAYLRNLGDGRFEDVGIGLGLDQAAHSMNVGAADLNRDGLPDFYISNILTLQKDAKYVLPTRDTEMSFDSAALKALRVVEANHLLMSVAAAGRLESYALSDAVKRGLTTTGWAWDADFFDYDADGDDDLYVVNGHIEYPIYDAAYDAASSSFASNYRVRETNVLLVNHEGVLSNAAAGHGADLLGNSRAATYLDYDADGDLDVAISGFHERAVLLRNDSEVRGNSWLKVGLIGAPDRGSPRDAVGAVIVATTPSGTRIWRAVQGGTGYLSDHPAQQHFGLGAETRADLWIRWPSGAEQTIEGLTLNREYVFQEGDASR